MTDTSFLILAVLAGIHAGSYALYEKKQGNTVGAAGIVFIILASIGLFAYRLFID